MFPLSRCFLLVLGSLAAFAQVRMIPHLTNPSGGFSSTVIVENNSPLAETVTLTPYDAAGNELDAVSLQLESGTVLVRGATELFAEEAAHFEITAADEVNIGVNYNFKAGNGSPALVAESNVQASGWRFFPGNWAVIFDGIAVVNMGDVPTDVWLAQKDTANNVLLARKVATALAPRAKALYVIGDPTGSEFTNEGDTFFELTGDQVLAITALRGTLGDAEAGLLWSNQSRALSRASSKRDDKGVWFIEDGSLHDVFEMIGYNVAGDRLAQMEFFRRLGRARMSELDPTFLEFDTIVRKLMYSDRRLEEIYAAMDAENRILIQAYVEGVNRRIGQVNGSGGTPDSLLPLEFLVLGLTTIEPWTFKDVMAHTARTQRQFSMRTAGSEQVLNGTLLLDLQERYGAEQGALMFDDLRFIFDPQTQTMIPDRASSKRWRRPANELPLAIAKKGALGLSHWLRGFSQKMERIEKLQLDRGIQVKMGSYAWVVSGDKTASGNPILFAGPQVGFSAPSLMVEGSVVSDTLTVSGMLIPGIPAFVIARTPHHAWSMQVGHANSWDYYVVDESEAFVDRTEIIKVRGGSDVAVEVEFTRHGPILDQFNDQRLAFKYAHLDIEFDLAGGILAMARATSMQEFGEGVAKLGISQHFIYADRDGNIAYWHSGRNPIRTPGDYRVPQGILANQEILEWDAEVLKPVVHESNPPEGWYAGWNNKASPDDVDVVATSTHGPWHRGHVIREFFLNYDPENPWTFEDLTNLAIDIGATGVFGAGGNPWSVLEAAVRAAVNQAPTPERQEAMALFDAWDGHGVAGGPAEWVRGVDLADASVLLEALIPKLLEKIFADEVGAPVRDYDMFFRFHAMLHGFYPEQGLSNRFDWFANQDAGAPQGANQNILAALDEALAQLGPRPWGRGKRDVIAYNNFLFGNIGALPAINLTPTPLANRAVYAQCIEFGSRGPLRIESFFALGQSGNIYGNVFQPILDTHVLSMKPEYDAFTMRPFPLFP